MHWSVERRDSIAIARYQNPPRNYFCAEGTQELVALIDEWRDQVARFSTTVTLPGNAPVPVRYEHYEGRNTAVARLLWTPPGGGQEVIGPGSLFLGIECAGDWDGNGVVNAADAGAFLSDYFQDLLNGTLVADFDDNGIVNAADVGAFLSAYFQDLTSPDCAGG